MCGTYSSDINVSMEKEFVFRNFDRVRRENSPKFGVERAEELVIQPVYYDELCYLLESEGAHILLFGGPWSRETQNVIDRVDFYARKNRIPSVYLFDFRADGETADTSIRSDLTEQTDYDGPGKRPPVACAECNYLYGELVSRYFRGLENWGSFEEITYLNLYQDAVSVPAPCEPFVIAYKKGQGVLTALELRNADEEIDEKLDAVMCLAAREGSTAYTYEDYMVEAFKMNRRGHSYKTEDCFKIGEPIRIRPVPLPVMRWLLRQEGTFLVLFAGAWCANSQAAVATINDYAVANDVNVYMMDTRLDGKYPIDFWGYPRLHELKLSIPALSRINGEIWGSRLAGAPLLCSIRPYKTDKKPVLTYVCEDENGDECEILPVNIPYLAAVNKSHVDSQGRPKPVLDGCNHFGIELINCADTFVYSAPNYRRYKAGVYAVMDAYCRAEGKTTHDIEVDRTAPVIQGEIQRNPDTKNEPKYFKTHNWYVERADRAEQRPGAGPVETQDDRVGYPS